MRFVTSIFMSLVQSTLVTLLLLPVVCRTFPQSRTSHTPIYPFLSYLDKDDHGTSNIGARPSTGHLPDKYDLAQKVHMLESISNVLKFVLKFSQEAPHEHLTTEGSSKTMLPYYNLNLLSRAGNMMEEFHPDVFNSLDLLMQADSQAPGEWRAMTRAKKGSGSMERDAGNVPSQQRLCGVVCGQCQRILSLRWSSLCWPECERGRGTAFSGCMAMIQHKIKNTRSMLGVMQS